MLNFVTVGRPVSEEIGNTGFATLNYYIDYDELLHYHIKIMSYLCYKHLFQLVVCRVSAKNVPKPHTPWSMVSVVTSVIPLLQLLFVHPG